MAKYDKEYKEKRDQTKLEKELLNKKDKAPTTKIINEADKSKLIEKLNKPVDKVIKESKPEDIKKLGQTLVDSANEKIKLNKPTKYADSNYSDLKLSQVEPDSKSKLLTSLEPKAKVTEPLNVSEGFKVSDSKLSNKEILSNPANKVKMKAAEASETIKDITKTVKNVASKAATTINDLAPKAATVGKNILKATPKLAAGAAKAALTGPAAVAEMALTPSQTGSPEEVQFEQDALNTAQANNQQNIQQLLSPAQIDPSMNQQVVNQSLPNSPNIPLAPAPLPSQAEIDAATLANDQAEQPQDEQLQPDQAQPQLDQTQAEQFQSEQMQPQLSAIQKLDVSSLGDSQLQTEIDNEKIKFAEREKELRSKVKSIDPNGFWNNKSTGEKVMLALAMAFSAYGSALTKTDDVVSKMIMNSIDQDIASQKENNNLTLGEIDVLKDEYLQNIQNQIAIRADKLKTVDSQNQARQINNQLQMQRDELQLRINDHMLKQAGNSVQQGISKLLVEAHTRGEGLSQEQLATIQQNSPESLKGLKIIPGANDRVYTSFTNPTEASMNKLTDRVIEANNSLNSLTRLQELAQDPKVKVPGSEAWTEAKSLSDGLVGSLRLDLVGPGTLSAQDMKFIKDVLPNPASLFSLNNMTKLNVIRNKAVNGMKSAFRVNGFNIPNSPEEIKFEQFKSKIEKKLGKNSKDYHNAIDEYLLTNQVTPSQF